MMATVILVMRKKVHPTARRREDRVTADISFPEIISLIHTEKRQKATEPPKKGTAKIKEAIKTEAIKNTEKAVKDEDDL